MSAMDDLVAALRDPASVAALDGERWSALISVARAEVLLGTLAYRLANVPLPAAVDATLTAARITADQAQVHALWEAEMCRRALAPLGIEPVLLKGIAYAAAGLANAAGRQIGDLDILVPRDRLDEVEAALLAAGWEWVKDDPYDQSYYRDHMHELPPLIHRERDRMIDVHHTILPLTAKPKPDATKLIADSVSVSNGLRILSREAMILHAIAHLFDDGDLGGGLRNLWDIDQLFRAGYDNDQAFLTYMAKESDAHQLDSMFLALRLAERIFGTPLILHRFEPEWIDSLFAAHLLARDDWGRETRPLLRFGFYIRSHLLRMPLPMLLKHLWVKWRKGQP